MWQALQLNQTTFTFQESINRKLTISLNVYMFIHSFMPSFK